MIIVHDAAVAGQIIEVGIVTRNYRSRVLRAHVQFGVIGRC